MAINDNSKPTRLCGRRQVTLFRCYPTGWALLMVALFLPSCSKIVQPSGSKLTLDTPIGWWHDLQGGKIAEVRPPPPGVDDPYPNLGQVPARPVMTDAATRRALAARLASERDRTQREATQDPLVLPAAAVAPAKPAVGAAPPPAAPPPDPAASVAVLDAATAPAAPPTPAPRAAPAAPTAAAPPSAPQVAGLPVESGPKPAPTSGPESGPSQSGPSQSGPSQSGPSQSGPLPELSASEPPLPRLGGLPASASAPAIPREPPGVSIIFRPGSAALPAAADAALRELAGRRAGAAVAVTAGGDAPGQGFQSQARALPLALRRARAIQEALVAAGVPAAALRIDAAATGRGGAAHLLQQ